MGGMHLSDMKKCPECGKEFSVLHPDMWTYRAPKFGNSRYYCSYTCYRAYELKGEQKKMGKAKLTDEQKKHAVEIAAGGGDPRPYLRKCGSQNPEAMWSTIRAWAKDALPDLAEKMPKTLRWIKTVETPEGEFAEKVEVPEAVPVVPKITKPVNYDGMTVRAVEGDFGSYHFQEINGKQWLDYDDRECSNDLSMTVEQWRGFLKEIVHAAEILGVEL